VRPDTAVTAGEALQYARMRRQPSGRRVAHQALEAAVKEAAGRCLAEANLNQVPAEQGLARATRVLVTVRGQLPVN
jgi:hypothetical protein